MSKKYRLLKCSFKNSKSKIVKLTVFSLALLDQKVINMQKIRKFANRIRDTVLNKDVVQFRVVTHIENFQTVTFVIFM